MSMSTQKRVAAAALSLSFSLGAQAASESIRIGSIAPDALQVTLARLGGSGDVAATPLNMVSSLGTSFVAWCVELAQPASFSFRDYTVGSFSGTQASQLQGLFSASSLYSGANKVDSALEYAAFQVAVWEITHESVATRSVASSAGSLYVSGLDSVDLAVAAKANAYLSDALAYQGPALFQLDKLSNTSLQDLVRATAVPELDRSLMMGLGLGVLAWLSRRRTQG